jgi:hypothetical protein
MRGQIVPGLRCVRRGQMANFSISAFSKTDRGRKSPFRSQRQRQPCLLTGLDVLDLEVAPVGDDIDILDIENGGLRPFRISVSSSERSPQLNRTTCFFTIISFAAMIASVARVATKAN